MSALPVAAAPLGARLTADGALGLVVAPHAAPPLVAAVAAWLPRSLAFGDPAAADAPALIEVAPAAPDDPLLRDALAARGPAPVLAFLGTELWRDGPDAMVLVAAGGGAAARFALGERRARIVVAAGDDATTMALHGMLTLAAAFLLGRSGRALIHAAALVAPDGRAWLLVGDARAGKSSTCATLLDAGWRYCADDHVVVDADSAEGWPRLMHLDPGWDAGEPTAGERAAVDALARWPGRWRRTAPLAGMLCPRVDAGLPTAIEPLTAADRFARLVRQAPWFLGDPVAAPCTVARLHALACRPGAALRLGRDSFRRPARLAEVLAPLVGAAAERAS